MYDVANHGASKVNFTDDPIGAMTLISLGSHSAPRSWTGLARYVLAHVGVPVNSETSHNDPDLVVISVVFILGS